MGHGRFLWRDGRKIFLGIGWLRGAFRGAAGRSEELGVKEKGGGGGCDPDRLVNTFATIPNNTTICPYNHTYTPFGGCAHRTSTLGNWFLSLFFSISVVSVSNSFGGSGVKSGFVLGSRKR